MTDKTLQEWERAADTKLELKLIQYVRSLQADNAALRRENKDLCRQVRDLEELLRREEARG